MRLAILCGLATVAAFAQSEPVVDAHQLTLNKVRNAALHYVEHLQDFTCNQITVRTRDAKQIETVEQELDFVGHKEHYTLLKLGGKPVSAKQRDKRGGLHTSGEFGSMLSEIFDPHSKADFVWDHEESPETCDFRFRVARQNSKFRMTNRKSETTFAYHGMVSASCGTGNVVRIQVDTEFIDDSAMQIDLTYAPVTIAGSEYLLPLNVTDVFRAGKTLLKSEIIFENYRKYEANTSIRFGDEVK